MTRYQLYAMFVLKAMWTIVMFSEVEGSTLVSEQPNTVLTDGTKEFSNNDLHERERRASISSNCNSWYPWVNNNTPTSTNKNDHEQISHDDVRAYCPIDSGAAIDVQCKDDKGEPFSGQIKDPNNRYGGNCSDLSSGVTCQMFDPNSADKCPDFSLRFYCNCTNIRNGSQGQASTTTTTNVTGHISIVTPTSATIASASPAATTSSSSTKTTITSASPAATTSSAPTSATITSAPSAATTSSVKLTTASTTPSNGSTFGSARTPRAGKDSEEETESLIQIFENRTVMFILFIICIVLIILNFILLLILHRRAMKHAKAKWSTKVKPLGLV